ncbi:hypothetical protein PG984_014123 [Apiospora sp. TS-2023a]
MAANFPHKSFQSDRPFWRAVARDRVFRVSGIDRHKNRDDFAAFLNYHLLHQTGHVEWGSSKGRNGWCYVILRHAGHVPQAVQKLNGREFGTGFPKARKWERFSPKPTETDVNKKNTITTAHDHSSTYELNTGEEASPRYPATSQGNVNLHELCRTSYPNKYILRPHQDYLQFKKEGLSDYAQLASAYTNAGSDVVLHTDPNGEFLPMSFSRTVGRDQPALQSGVAMRDPHTSDYKIVPMAEKKKKNTQPGWDGNDLDTRAPPEKGLDVRTTDQPTDDINARFSPVASVLEKSAARPFTPGLAFFPSDPETSISTASQFDPPPELDGLSSRTMRGHCLSVSRPPEAGLDWGDFDVFHEWQLAGRHVPTDLPPLDWVPEGTPTLSFGNNGALDKTFTADAKLREDAVRPGNDELSFTPRDKISSKGRKNAAAVGTNASQKKT